MKLSFISVLLFCTLPMISQQPKKIIAGPMLGHTELRTTEIWLEFTPEVKKASIIYWNPKSGKNQSHLDIPLAGGEFNTGKFILTGLEPGTTYVYNITADKVTTPTDTFTTQLLWNWRVPAPDFSFLTGSCAYFNEPVYDRPGKPYGGDSSIFETMAKENAAFTLWLGDNWYTREPDYFSEWGLSYRASRDRSLTVLQNLLKKMPQYAIWDDHDYGPNDADKSYILKEPSRSVFMKYWANPSYGFNGQGIYSKITWNDVDIFMMDDRWYRSNDKMPDSISGQPNKDKKMYGEEQMEWLKNSLLFSNKLSEISFRIIATGSQVLNSYSPYDCLRHFPAEFNELLNFISDNKINGVLFLTGDRHHSEIIKMDRKETYPLYDITVSPFTSGIGKTHGAELHNPTRIGKEIDEQNYARFSLTGKGNQRVLKVSFIGLHGENLSEWSAKRSEVTSE